MGTFSVTHTVRDASATALPNVLVVANLNKNAFRTTGGAQVARRKEYTTDANGLVTMVLEANADMTPTDTWWTVQVDLPVEHGGPQVFTARSTANQTLLESLFEPPA